MSFRNQIKLGILLSYFNFFITAVMGLLYIPFLIHILPENEYGLYLLMYSFMSLISVLDMGMTGTITRFYSQFDYQNDQIGKIKVLTISKRIYCILSLVILVSGLIFFFLFNYIYSKSLSSYEMVEAKSILIIIVINAVILIQSNIYIAVIQAKERFVFQRGVLILRSLLIPAFAIFFSFVLKKAIGIFLAYLFCNVFFYGCYFFYVKNFFGIPKTKIWDKVLFKELLSFAFFLFLNTVVDELYWNTNTMVLGAIGGATAVAVYGTANTIVTQFRGISSVIHGVFLPRLTNMVISEVKNNEINNLFFYVSKIQFVLVFLIYSGFFLLGKDFVRLWAGEEYIEAYNLAMITMTALVVPLTQSIGISILRAYNRQKFRAVLYIFLAFLNVFFSIPAAYFFQGYGCACVTAFFLFIGNTIIMDIYYQKKIHLNMKQWWIQFIKMLVPVIFSILIFRIIKMRFIINSFYTLGIAIFLYIMVYIVLIYSLGLTENEKIFVLKQLKLKK